MYPGVSAAPEGPGRLREEETEDAEALIDASLAQLVSTIAVTRVVARGAPANTLEKLARGERAQLLVIGASGKGSLGTLLMGSVSQHLIGHAWCPVVVVPPNLTRSPHEEDGATASDSSSPDLAVIALDRMSR